MVEDALGIKPPTHDANGNLILKSRDQVVAENALSNLKQELRASEQMLSWGR